MLRKKFFVFVLFAAAFFIYQQTADACSCRAKPTVLEAFENSEMVVIVKVVSVEKVREKERQFDIGYIKSAKMVVEKVYKGNVKVGDELIFGQGGGSDCRWTYDEEYIGKKILFYLDAPSKGYPYAEFVSEDTPLMYYPITCGRSESADYVVDDLLYLDNLNKVRGKTRLSGTLDGWSRNAPSFANAQIKIIGKNKTYFTKTDQNGVYEIYDLPAGEYFIEPKVPFGWTVNERMLQYSASYLGNFGDQLVIKNRVPIIVKEGRHAALDLLFVIDNAIRGKVISPTGKPMKDVCVQAIPADADENFFPYQSGCTKEKGEFEITEIPPGNYILVINADGKISVKEPFGTLFYPGVSERKNASVVSIDAGKFLNGINIQIPKTVELIEVRGQFLYSDEEPVDGGDIKFEPSQSASYDNITAKTDSQGQFSIKIPKGVNGIIFGSKYFYGDYLKNCSKLNAIVKASKTGDVKTNEIEIDGTENLFDLKVIFPFPYCEKAKD